MIDLQPEQAGLKPRDSEAVGFRGVLEFLGVVGEEDFAASSVRVAASPLWASRSASQGLSD